MSLLFSKLCGAGIIFSLALLAGFLPMRISPSKKHLLSIGDAFAGGVFLSASLLHMIPEAITQFQQSMPNLNYPIALLIIAVTFVVLFLLENSVLLFKDGHTHHDASLSTPYLLAIIVMVHSLLEGAAIGISDNLASASIILAAVLAHKGSESFALALNLHRHKLRLIEISVLIFAFSMMTPLGILITNYVGAVLQNTSAQYMTAILNSLAAGTFLYLGAVHIIGEPEHIACRCGIIALTAGMALMAAVAIWV